MPIIILRNDYTLGLFNGDAGVLWPDAQGALQAWFEQENGMVRAVGLSRLPAWQTSYAITVHKSQGSEFAEVLFILPQEDAPVLSRELLYTGITRAKNTLILACCREVLLRVVQRRVVRHSGLGAKLRAPTPIIPL
jgi:exodeoxyribonuclease V alpha subunit